MLELFGIRISRRAFGKFRKSESRVLVIFLVLPIEVDTELRL